MLVGGKYVPDGPPEKYQDKKSNRYGQHKGKHHRYPVDLVINNVIVIQVKRKGDEKNQEKPGE